MRENVAPNQKEIATLMRRGFSRVNPLSSEFTNGKIRLAKATGDSGRHFYARAAGDTEVLAVANTVEGLLARLDVAS